MSKDCQAVLEVVHGRYRHIMPATTGKPGHETPSGLHRIAWRWPGGHVSSKYRENGRMFDRVGAPVWVTGRFRFPSS